MQWIIGKFKLSLQVKSIHKISTHLQVSIFNKKEKLKLKPLLLNLKQRQEHNFLKTQSRKLTHFLGNVTKCNTDDYDEVTDEQCRPQRFGSIARAGDGCHCSSGQNDDGRHSNPMSNLIEKDDRLPMTFDSRQWTFL